jgi:SRSO17 transposase
MACEEKQALPSYVAERGLPKTFIINAQLKEAVAELLLHNRILKKSMNGEGSSE